MAPGKSMAPPMKSLPAVKASHVKAMAQMKKATGQKRKSAYKKAPVRKKNTHGSYHESTYKSKN